MCGLKFSKRCRKIIQFQEYGLRRFSCEVFRVPKKGCVWKKPPTKCNIINLRISASHLDFYIKYFFITYHVKRKKAHNLPSKGAWGIYCHFLVLSPQPLCLYCCGCPGSYYTLEPAPQNPGTHIRIPSLLHSQISFFLGYGISFQFPISGNIYLSDLLW